MARQVASSETAIGGDETSVKPDHRIIEEYLAELKNIRASGAGVAETSYYPALSGLFNAVGRTLKPKVRSVIHLSNQGAGISAAHARRDQVRVRLPIPESARGLNQTRIRGFLLVFLSGGEKLCGSSCSPAAHVTVRVSEAELVANAGAPL
jgi:hypothetical protein